MNDFLLIAVTDPLLLPEATHAVAATGREVITCEDPRDIVRHAPRAGAILADAATAAHVGACPGGAPVFFLAPDPGPIDYEAALRCHAQAAFIVPAESAALLTALGQASRAPDSPPAAGHCLAVVGAAGGLGTSTFAAALARYAAPAPSALPVLVDAAPAAGGLDLLLGIEDVSGARWPDLSLSGLTGSGGSGGSEGSGSVDPADVRRALPATSDGIAVLSGARATVADPFSLDAGGVDAAVGALRGLGLVVVDGAVPVAADHAVVLTAAEVRSAAAAAQWVHRLAADGIASSVVVRERDWSSLSVEDVERVVRADVVAQLPTVRRLPRAVETSGLPLSLPRPLERACELVLSHAGCEL